MRRTDIAHFGLMAAALGFSYLLPFELVLLSYVFLGPLHYLTEISWLHDRGYFLPHRGVALALIVTALAASFIESAFWSASSSGLRSWPARCCRARAPRCRRCCWSC